MKKKIKIFSAILLLFSLILPLHACLSPVSLDAYGYVISIGVDRGRDKRYYFTLALQRELSEPGTEHEGGAAILASEGDTLDEAVTEIEGGVPFTLSFSRTSVFIFSRETAESGDMEDVLSLSFDSMKIRPSASICVSECEAYRFIGGLTANNDANIRKLQEAVMLDQEKTGMVTLSPVSRMFESVREGGFDYCAALGECSDDIITDMAQKKAENDGEDPLKDVEIGDRVGGLKSYVSGAALFSGWRMTGSLTRDDTMYLNIACGSFENGSVTIPCTGGDGEEGSITIILSAMLLERDMRIEGGKPFAVVKVRLAAGIHGKPASLTLEETEAVIEDTAARLVERRLHEVFMKCIEARSDAMRFGTDAVKLFGSYDAWRAYGWKSHYPDLEACFEVQIMCTDKLTSGDLQ